MKAPERIVGWPGVNLGPLVLESSSATLAPPARRKCQFGADNTGCSCRRVGPMSHVCMKNRGF